MYKSKCPLITVTQLRHYKPLLIKSCCKTSKIRKAWSNV